ncbi:SGNH/GDSL hydrolase family protein [Arthrobacter sp. AQ5-06]|nr:SGNH/GDSL hydrolase family protein [Arthrobacter sp. AQ5-06]
MKRVPPLHSPFAFLVTALLVSSLVSAVPAQAAKNPDPDPNRTEAVQPATKKPARVDEKDRDKVLGKGWKESPDQAWTTVADQDGFHILRSVSKEGYKWEQVATLNEPLISTDKWIGNACSTSDGKYLAVVYAPRDFTNSEQAANLGGFAATVDLTSGAVRRLGQGFSLAYYNPGCGFSDRFVLSRQAKDESKSQMLTLSAETGAVLSDQVVPGQFSSAVPTKDGIVAAVSGSLQFIGTDSLATPLTATSGVGYGLTVVGDELAYAERSGESATVKITALSRGPQTSTKLADGPVVGTRPVRDGLGQIYVTGSVSSIKAKKTPKGTAVSRAPAGSRPSSHGRIAVEETQSLSTSTPDGAPGQTEISGQSLLTAASLKFSAETTPILESRPGPDAAQIQTLQQAGAPVSSANIAEADRACAVPRNDLMNQVLQPKPRQVQWTVDQLVQHSLAVTRPANWKNLNMPAYDVAQMFPQIPLEGGGDVPPQILLGIIAQESNVWQASRFAMPGVTGNPLVGNYYGTNLESAVDSSWGWNFAEADCGYGLTQVTDGMRLGGALPYQTQRAIALDYAANVAAGLRILQEKWNQTRSNGLMVHDGDPEMIENWFLAVWAYNSGFYEDRSEPWGVGWFNNPANPRYPPDRGAFLDLNRHADAAHPQDWPYQEKVLGFAAAPPSFYENPNDAAPVAGFTAAWWLSSGDRTGVKPPLDTFCTTESDCYPNTLTQPTAPGLSGEPAGPCQHKNAAGQYDLHCYFHGTAAWKSDCSTTCGNGFIRFPAGWAYQADGTSYLPNCSRSGLPADALIVDDVPGNIPPVREGCTQQASNGSFSFAFGQNSSGQQIAKTDLHQLGAGLNAHFFFAHTRDAAHSLGDGLLATGKWTLDRPLQQWTRVFIHLPELAAWTQQAAYTIDLGNGQKQTRYLPQRVGTNKWVSIGVFQVSGTPSVTLSNRTFEGDGVDDVAWDAVAFQPLPAKPKDVVVALGDSYSSGEGTGIYYPETDNNGIIPDGADRNRFQNACHRSPDAWSRKAALPGSGSTVGQRADSSDVTLDYHMVSCSGAETFNLLPNHSTGAPPTNSAGRPGEGQYREVSQLDSGYLDASTTVVTLSIGGNDVQFGPTIKACVTPVPLARDCMQDAPEGQPGTTRLDWSISYANGPLTQDSLLVLREIKKKAPNARIVLMGYPLVVEQQNPSGLCSEDPSPSCEDSSQYCAMNISPWELNDIKTVANNLAAKQQLLVQTARSEGINVSFADTRTAFSGKSACADSSVRAINELMLIPTPGENPLLDWFGPFGPSAQSFHPNQKGTSLYAELLTQALR